MLNKKQAKEIAKALTGIYLAWQGILEFQTMHAESQRRLESLKDELMFWKIINSNNML